MKLNRNFSSLLICLFSVLFFTPHLIGSTLLGEGYYKQGHYQKALKEFQSHLKSHPNNPDILFNLVNTYLKLDQVGEAITHYKQALQLTPRDQQLQENLNFAREKVVDKIENKEENILSIDANETMEQNKKRTPASHP